MSGAKIAEVIAIGDEITSGQRLDTNSQWISGQLGDMGVRVAFHSSVGDTFEEMVTTFANAVTRADVIICTGGLGPTADDLTRQVMAEVAGVELEFDQATLDRILEIYASHSRQMPESNRSQAFFPAGSTIIKNPEGTAPGIEMTVESQNRKSTIFALPGVPYELKQMWPHVEGAVNQLTGSKNTTHHHVIHCFGGGESQIEQMLVDLTDRDRTPRVGITASQATISLRITSVADSREACIQQIQPTIQTINSKLGQLVFGENGVELEQVVVDLLDAQNKTLAIADFGFGGIASQKLHSIDLSSKRLKASLAMGKSHMAAWCTDQSLPIKDVMRISADKVREQFETDIGVAIGPAEKSPEGKTRAYQVAIATPETPISKSNNYGGHSGLRQERTAKQILNEIRLHLINS